MGPMGIPNIDSSLDGAAFPYKTVCYN